MDLILGFQLGLDNSKYSERMVNKMFSLNNTVNKTLNGFIGACLVVLCSGFYANAQTPSGFDLVVYEGFNYSSGTSLLNANSGTGWTSNWEMSYQQRYLKTSTTGFTYSGLTTEGLKAEFDSTCYGSCNDIASLKRSLPLQNSGVVYFQFIANLESSAGFGTPSIRLKNGTSLTGGFGASTGNKMSILDASGANDSATSSILNQQNLVVVRIDYNLNKTEMWVNPNLATFNYLSPTSPSATKNFAPEFNSFEIFIRAGFIDEISVFKQTPINPFITTWQTDGSNNVTIPLNGGGYNFTIDWGDGNSESMSGSPGNITHNYVGAGDYTVSITPNTLSGFPRIYVNSFANRDYLKSVDQWGGGQWSTMERAFYGASIFDVLATDAPDLSLVTNFNYTFLNCNALSNSNGSMGSWVLTTDPTKSINMGSMFQSANAFNQDIGSWNMERVTNMNSMFYNAHVFNQNIDGWDVSNVTNMVNMFVNAKVFNQPLNSWTVSNVTSFSGMFQSATVFNQPLNSWVFTSDPSKSIDMSNIFQNTPVFDQDLSNWNVERVTKMSGMFYNATAFNQPLNAWGIKTGNVTTMRDMFRQASVFNQVIDGWDVSNVTDTNLMFYQANSFNQNLNSWDVSSLINPSQMFQNAASFNGDISSWTFTTDPAKSINMNSMFQSATVFNQDISGWNVERVSSMSSMFNDAKMFNQNINGWNVSNVTNMSSMFNNALVFNQPLNGWLLNSDPSKSINMSSMFQNTPVFDQDLINWNVERVNIMSSMFNNAQAFNQDISTWDVSNVTNMSSMFRYTTVFNQPLNAWGIKTSNVSSMQEMFREAQAFNQDIDDWDVSSVTTTHLMFYKTNNFNQDLNSWDVSSLVNPSHMFRSNTAFNGDISNWQFTTDPAKNINMTYMFQAATVFNTDISAWNVERVTNMSNMFDGAKVFNQNINSWDVSNVTNMSSMFNNALVFNQPLNGWVFTTDPSKSINMTSMFQSTPVFNQDLSNWNVERVNNMSSMFRLTTVFNTNISSWDVSNVTNMSGMFYSATAFNQPLNAWGTKTGNVTSMREMFRQTPAFNQDISSWDTSKVTTFWAMFYQGGSFNQDLGVWDISSLTDAEHFMTSLKLSRVNYDNILKGWETLDSGETLVPENININFGSSKYSNNTVVITSRTNLIDNKTWTIIDGGMVSVLTNNGELSGSQTVNVNKNGVLGVSSGVSSNGEIID